jgi:hypothetical protein
MPELSWRAWDSYQQKAVAAYGSHLIVRLSQTTMHKWQDFASDIATKLADTSIESMIIEASDFTCIRGVEHLTFFKQFEKLLESLEAQPTLDSVWKREIINMKQKVSQCNRSHDSSESKKRDMFISRTFVLSTSSGGKIHLTSTCESKTSRNFSMNKKWKIRNLKANQFNHLKEVCKSVNTAFFKDKQDPSHVLQFLDANRELAFTEWVFKEKSRLRSEFFFQNLIDKSTFWETCVTLYDSRIHEKLKHAILGIWAEETINNRSKCFDRNDIFYLWKEMLEEEPNFPEELMETLTDLLGLDVKKGTN